MPFTEQDVLAALRDVYDPELPINIVDLGLVYRVDVAIDTEAPGAGIPGVPPRHRVDIDVTMTSQGCPAHELIIEKVKRLMKSVKKMILFVQLLNQKIDPNHLLLKKCVKC